jgi:hypothetical protein
VPALHFAKTRHRRAWVWCAIAALCTVVAPLQSLPAGPYITVAWDSSPDERVVAYVVYVGTQPGRYNEAFVVRDRTFFTYPNAVPGRPYYFAVAAYAGGSLLGGPSAEVSGYGQATPAIVPPGDIRLSALETPSSLTASCTGAQVSACVPPDSAVVSTEGSIGALAATGNGRLLIVEDARRVRIFDFNSRAISPRAALVAPRNVSFIGIAADPRFEQSRRVYVAEAEQLADGARELRIVRYRDVQDTLGEPAVIVAGVPLPATGAAPFTVDSDGRIFIAISATQTNTNPSRSVVLGFEPDGSALRLNRAASPVIGWGPSAPTTMVWDDQAQQLWLSGVDGAAAAVVRIPVNSLTSSDEWPRVPRIVRVVFTQPGIGRVSERGHTENTAMLLVPTPLGARVSRVSESADGAAEVFDLAQGQPAAIAWDPQTKSAYVATAGTFGAGSYILKIN